MARVPGMIFSRRCAPHLWPCQALQLAYMPGLQQCVLLGVTREHALVGSSGNLPWFLNFDKPSLMKVIF